MNMAKGTIYEINGPVVKVDGTKELTMMEMVRVGGLGLIGEVIAINNDYTIVQVYEPTAGIKPGEPVEGTGSPMSVILGPGIIGGIFDGIERPLKKIKELTGDFIDRGVNVDCLDTAKKWKIKVCVSVGSDVCEGMVIATTIETESVLHKSMVPPGLRGKVTKTLGDGEYTIAEPIVVIEDEKGVSHELSLAHKSPIRRSRPYAKRRVIEQLLVTGQRVIDTMFPIAKGGTASVPGGFGTGKTMTQHQLAKWSDADIIVYIGCGERGNEMTQVLEDFTGLTDPRTGKALMDRTVLIANTSNMPVAAREASIYTGITIAEYYRDMGYHVAIMADSTSRWAEALREISGRLEEMPAEEGFPAYLPSRLSEFYERAGFVDNLNGTQGSVTIIGAVSPQGGDFSEPVTQNTKRFIRCFWALDRQLAYSRHYPAINWLTSYSEYQDELEGWFEQNAGEKFLAYRAGFVAILHAESKLMEIVKLIGSDVLPDSQRLELEIAKVIREGYLQQNAFHANDTYVPLAKQYRMMEVILHLFDVSKQLVQMGVPVSLIKQNGIFEEVIAMKYNTSNDNLQDFDKYISKIDELQKNIACKYS